MRHNHQGGCAVIATTGGPPPRPPRPARVPVIVEIQGDGFVTVFAPDFVDVRVIHRIETATPEGATLADQYHEPALPRVHREVYQPNCVRACGGPERRTAESELHSRWRLDVVRACNDLLRQADAARTAVAL